MRTTDLYRPSSMVMAICLAGSVGLTALPSTAETVSDDRTVQQSTSDTDATIVVTSSGSIIVPCDNDPAQNAVNVGHGSFTVRIDDGGEVKLVDNGPNCNDGSAAIRAIGGLSGTVTINGLLETDGLNAILIGTQGGTGLEKSVTVNVGATGEINGDIKVIGDDDFVLSNLGDVNGTVSLNQNGLDTLVEISNRGVLDGGASNIAIKDESTAIGTTTITNIGQLDENGLLDATTGLINGDITLNGSDRVYSLNNSGTINGEIGFGTANIFGGASITNSGVLNAGVNGNVLAANNVGDDQKFITMSNTFTGTVTGNLSFGNDGNHAFSNSGDIVGVVTFGDGDNAFTFSGGTMFAANDILAGQFIVTGAGDDIFTLNNGIIAPSSATAEVTDADGIVTGFSFPANAQNGTLISLGNDNDTATLSGGALGGATTLIDMGNGDDDLKFVLTTTKPIAFDPNGIIRGGATGEVDGDSVDFNVAGHADGFTFTDLAKLADFENLNVTAGVLNLDPDAGFFDVSGGDLTISTGATLNIVKPDNLNNGFTDTIVSGVLALNKATPLFFTGNDSSIIVKAGGQIEFRVTDETDFGSLTTNNRTNSLTFEDGSTFEVVIPRGAITTLTDFNSTQSLTLANADNVDIANQGTVLVDDDPFHRIVLDPTTLPGELRVTVTLTPGFQQIIQNNGLTGFLGTVGAALDAEYDACTNADLNGADPLCNEIATLGVTNNSDADILSRLALAVPDRTGGEHSMRADTQKSLHSLIGSRANVLRARSRSMPSGVGSGSVDRRQTSYQNNSNLSPADRQLAGLSDNLTRSIDGNGPGELINLGDGLSAGSVWSAHNIWFQGYSAFTERDRGRNNGGFDANQFGIAMGYDWRASRTWLFGAYTGYSLASIDGADLGRNEVDIDTISGGAYMSWFDRYTSWTTTMSFGFSEFDGERLGFGGSKVTREHDGVDFGLSSLIDTNITIANRLILTPAADLYFGLFDRDGYQETGAFGLTVEDKTSYSLRTGIAAKLAAPGQIGRTGVLPYIRTGVSHEFLDDTNDTTASFTGSKAGASFSVDAIDIASTQYLAGLGIDIVSPRGGVNFTFGYNFIGGDDTTSHTLNSNLRIRF